MNISPSQNRLTASYPVGLNRRLSAVFIFILIGAALIVIRLFILMVLQHNLYVALAANSQEFFSQLSPERGSIYLQDSRSGEEYPAAINRDFFIVFADTREIKDDKTAENVAIKLTEVFAYSAEDKLELYYKLNKRDDPYEPIEQKVDEEVMERIQALALPGIGFVRRPERYYPENNLAAQVLGFYGQTDDGQGVGRYGVEGFWNRELVGSGGFLSGERSAAGRIVSLVGGAFKPPENGADILLSIDRTLQFKACERLRQGLVDYKASGASLIIMDPMSGAIRAMCGLPDFNPNTYNEVSSVSIYNNSAIFTPYEPGSVFKPIVMAAALNEGVVRAETEFFDTGSVEAGCKKPIKNAGNKTYEKQSMVGVLENSINTGMVYVAEKLGRRKLVDYVEAFGFGIKEGLELDSEAPGNIESLYKNENKEFDCYTATASFGQGISATPIQLVTAFGVLANGGSLIKPYIVEEVRYADGRVEKAKPKEIRKVIDKKTASIIGGMLVNVVDNGHAKAARVKGYYVAGKTGTAQIAGPGGYTEDTNHSFVGYAPIDDPRFVMIIKFEKPAAVYSESTAVPVFGDIAEFALQYYQVPPAR